MAKKKDEEEANVQNEFTDRIYSEIEKEYGKDVLMDGNSVLDEYRQIIPVSPAIDIITSGGIQEGSWVGITGVAKGGKTSLALSFAAQCQKPEYGSRPIYYDKVEGRMSALHVRGIKGLDTSKGKFNVIQSTKDKILTSQEHLSILTKILKTVPKAVIIIDSISAYCDEKEMTDGVGTETRGGGAKIFGQFCRLMNNVVPVQKSIVIGITHLISNTSGFGASLIERAAKMWGYQADYQLRIVQKKPWKAGETQIGLTTEWVCNTSALGPPGMKIESYLRFGTGIDRLFELMTLATEANLIKKAGAWISLPFLDEELDEPLKPLQGAEKVYDLLLKNPQWIKILEKKVFAMAGTLAGSE